MKELFNDKNSINEKSIIGFASFVTMLIFAVVDLATGFFGKDLVIHEYIYDSFLIITLGCFGIAEVGSIFGSKKAEESAPSPEPEPEDKAEKNINININDDDW